MACFDLGVPADADCAAILAAKKAELASRPTPCDTSLVESCGDSCGAGHSGRETRDHWYMLMTSPPP
jgi:hypothetical protein